MAAQGCAEETGKEVAMLKKLGIVALLVILGLGVVGFSQSDLGDGSAPYPGTEDLRLPPEKISEPSPQVAWRGCCSETWEVPGTRRVVYEGLVCLRTWWHCAGDPGMRGTFYLHLEEAQFCCYKGWKVFGICVSQDSTPTCWWRSERRMYFIGCGCAF